ncbi:MAG: sigma-54 dependent transcriptional regulator [Candidatus Zixiibacteriota bacterium]
MSGDLNANKISVLIVDDEEATRRLLRGTLSGAGYTVFEAETLSSTLASLRERPIDLVLTDLRLGEESGMDIIKAVRQSFPDIESILVTGFASIESAVEAMRAGAFDYVTKPFSPDELVVKVQKAVERKQMRQELTALRQHVAMNYGFDNIVGISKPMMRLKEAAKRIAPTDITVMITGPSGTGKELFARAIHYHSNRRTGRFVAIDCSALPEGLLESELFGHMKGSFTSAIQNKKGLFEEADGGTVFLDELSNMPMSTQAKLLRFLQDSEVRPVGAVASRKVNLRVIAASNKDLRTMVAEGTLREDLYYRLNVIPLTLPPLVERAEDIEILTDYFLRKMASESGHPLFSISRPAIDKLLSHTWPGNVRELENTLKRGAALCSGEKIEAEDILFISGERPVETVERQPGSSTLTLKGGLLDSGQRSLIIKALKDSEWNFTKAAAELGIGRTTLWRKLKKYNLTRETVADS